MMMQTELVQFFEKKIKKLKTTIFEVFKIHLGKIDTLENRLDKLEKNIVSLIGNQHVYDMNSGRIDKLEKWRGEHYHYLTDKRLKILEEKVLGEAFSKKASENPEPKTESKKWDECDRLVCPYSIFDLKKEIERLKNQSTIVGDHTKIERLEYEIGVHLEKIEFLNKIIENALEFLDLPWKITKGFPMPCDDCKPKLEKILRGE